MPSRASFVRASHTHQWIRLHPHLRPRAPDGAYPHILGTIPHRVPDLFFNVTREPNDSVLWQETAGFMNGHLSVQDGPACVGSGVTVMRSLAVKGMMHWSQTDFVCKAIWTLEN